MKKSKRRKTSTVRAASEPVMVMPRQTSEEISRRREIREALHDSRAKTLNGRDR